MGNALLRTAYGTQSCSTVYMYCASFDFKIIQYTTCTWASIPLFSSVFLSSCFLTYRRNMTMDLNLVLHLKRSVEEDI